MNYILMKGFVMVVMKMKCNKQDPVLSEWSVTYICSLKTNQINQKMKSNYFTNTLQC